MRLAGVVLAILLIAACPPRRGRVVYYVQPCPAPVVIQPYPVAAVPVMPAPVPPGPMPDAVVTDPTVDHLLNQWEQMTANVTNMRAEIALRRTDSASKKETDFTGKLLLMKPNFSVIRLNNTSDPTNADYEAYICDGKTVFAYNGALKTITKIVLPQNQPVLDNLMFDFMTGIKAKDVRERLDIVLSKKDENYIYLDIRPRLPNDQREFKHLRLALYAAGPATARFAYLPAQVFVLKPNGDTEVWKFSDPHENISGISKENFKFVPMPGWKVQQEP